MDFIWSFVLYSKSQPPASRGDLADRAIAFISLARPGSPDPGPWEGQPPDLATPVLVHRHKCPEGAWETEEPSKIDPIFQMQLPYWQIAPAQVTGSRSVG